MKEDDKRRSLILGNRHRKGTPALFALFSPPSGKPEQSDGNPEGNLLINKLRKITDRREVILLGELIEYFLWYFPKIYRLVIWLCLTKNANDTINIWMETLLLL